MKESRKKKKAHVKTTKRLSASARIDAEIAELEGIIAETKPASGENPLAVQPRKSSERDDALSLTGVRKFAHLPISQATKAALRECRFKEMTAIQRATLPHALCGRDVLGAAKTGSGKTLAYVIPLIESLWRKKWGATRRRGGAGDLTHPRARDSDFPVPDEGGRETVDVRGSVDRWKGCARGSEQGE